ncbi:DUF4011 domain-containing protein [Elioraea sp.]|uniref:DUF4011 domain-containing protein n=1 Tax=Elioraea sp. TaxID=2185103 RepID=UPI003F6EA776
MTDPVVAALTRAQRELLDLSTRNRLLSLPTRSAGVLPIAGERSGSVFARLVTEAKAMGFAPMEDEAAGEAGPRRRRAAAAPGAASVPDPDDLVLSAPLTAAALARLLTRIERDARGFREEQGLNILYLALGHLIWSDPRTPQTERRAPLLLLPCTLARAGTAARSPATSPSRRCWRISSASACPIRPSSTSAPPTPGRRRRRGSPRSPRRSRPPASASSRTGSRSDCSPSPST